MNIYLSVKNRKEVLKLPILPEEFKINNPQNNETFTTINQGDIKLLGKSGLKDAEISSFFPRKPTHYSFSRNKKIKGWQCVKMINGWIEKEYPVRLIVTGTPINILMTIDNFEYGVEDKVGDIFYSLSLSEFKKIKLKKKKK